MFTPLEESFPPGVRDAHGCLIGTVLCCFCTSESMHTVKCAARRLLQGLMLDPNRKMIPLKTQGAILYGLISWIERGCFHTPALSKRSFLEKRLNLNFLLTLPVACSQNHHRTETLHCLDGCGSDCKGCSFFYSSLLTCSIYISDHCMYVLTFSC